MVGQREVGRLPARCCRVGAGTAVSGHFLTELQTERVTRERILANNAYATLYAV